MVLSFLSRLPVGLRHLTTILLLIFCCLSTARLCSTCNWQTGMQQPLSAFSLLLFLLSILAVLLSFGSSAAAYSTDFVLLLSSEECAPCINTVFLHPLTLDSDSNLTLTINASEAALAPLYTANSLDFKSSLSDGLTALPSPGSPSTFLVAHSANGVVQYNKVTTNSSAFPALSSSLFLSDFTPAVAAFLPGIGEYPLLLKWLFRIDSLDSYFGLSWVTVESPAAGTSDMHLYIYRDVDKYSASYGPTFQLRQVLPYEAYESGVTGGVAAVDHEAARVFINVAFWQSALPGYSDGQLLTYDARANAIVHNSSYPLNVTSYLDYSVEMTWSRSRQQLFGCIFYGWSALALDAVDPASGKSQRIASYDSSAISLDLYDSLHVLDDERGQWYILTVDEMESPPEGLPWWLFSINVDSGQLGPVNQLLLPWQAIGIAFRPPPGDGSWAQQDTLQEREKTARPNAAAALEDKRRQQERRRRIMRPAGSATQL